MARNQVRDLLRSGDLTRYKLTAGQSIVLLALADHADKSGVSFPSQDLLALEVGMSRLGVRKALASLESKELIEVVEPGGPRRSARYRVTLGPRFRATQLPVSESTYGQLPRP